MSDLTAALLSLGACLALAAVNLGLVALVMRKRGIR